MPEIEAKAAAWAVRVDAGPLTEAQRGELDGWLAQDRRHRGAFLRAKAGLRLVDHAQEAQAEAALGVLGAHRRRKSVAPRWTAIGGLAAAAAVAAVFALQPGGGYFRTAVGEQRRVALQDGSVALINTDSRVDVRLASAERRIALRQGEAWFQVAKDHSRPFVVDAGEVQVQATGTAFSVRRLAGGVQVAVTEGRVLTWRKSNSDQMTALSAGQAAFLPNAPAVAVRTEAARPDDILAWRRGEIVLSGETITTAAAEFNRYNNRKIVVRDADAGRQTIIGYFLIDQPEEFALAAARLTGDRISENDGQIVIESSQQK